MRYTEARWHRWARIVVGFFAQRLLRLHIDMIARSQMPRSADEEARFLAIQASGKNVVFWTDEAGPCPDWYIPMNSGEFGRYAEFCRRYGNPAQIPVGR